MDSSFLLYREYMKSYAIGKIVQYEDIKYSIPPRTECKYDFYFWSLNRWVCNEIIARIVTSTDETVSEIIRNFLQDLELWSNVSQNYKNKMDFAIACFEAKRILKIFSEGDSK